MTHTCQHWLGRRHRHVNGDILANSLQRFQTYIEPYAWLRLRVEERRFHSGLLQGPQPRIQCTLPQRRRM